MRNIRLSGSWATATVCCFAVLEEGKAVPLEESRWQFVDVLEIIQCLYGELVNLFQCR
jgi:hypothetical protein